MTKVLQWLLISLTVIMLSACGGGSSTTNVEISGYAEDDPIAGAKVKLYDNGGNVISETKADENGHYQLDARVEKGKQYTLESQGVLAGQDVVLHSIFQYASNTEINTNPITELKYQLVRSGKSIDEAEALIRDYFIEINGETLEENRFDVQSSLAMGMTELAQLYGGQLPVDAVEKIKEDILNNDGIENKDFSYRNLVKNTITLEASAESVPVGEPVTVKVSGLSELNSNYEIKWSGIPEDANVSEKSVSFTVNDFAQDLVIGMIVINKSNEQIILSVEKTINFYKKIAEQTFRILDTEVDYNLTIGENVLLVPANTLFAETSLNIAEYTPSTVNTISRFEINFSEGSDKNVTFKYKYNPYIVPDPRKLRIVYSNGENSEVLKITNIDYAQNTIDFEIPLKKQVSRGVFSSEIIRVEMVQSQPSKRQVYSFITDYKKYIEQLIGELFGENDKIDIINYLYEDDFGNAKFIKVLTEQNSNGIYNYNILAGIVNQMIAYENAKMLHYYNENDWKEFTYRYLASEKLNVNYRTSFDYFTPIKQITQVIAPWVGAVKATNEQISFVNNVKLAINIGFTVAATAAAAETGGTAATVAASVGLAGAAIDYAWPSDMAPDATGYAWTTFTTLAQEGIKYADLARELGTNFIIGFGGKFVTAYYEKDNIKASAPVFLTLGLDQKWSKLGGEFSWLLGLNAKSYTIEEFKEEFFPNPVVIENDIDRFYEFALEDINDCRPSEYVSQCDGESYLGKLDPSGILGRTFLSPYTDIQADYFLVEEVYSDMSQEDRNMLYTIIRFAYGDTKSEEQLKKLISINKIAGYKILLKSLLMKKEEVIDPITFSPCVPEAGDICNLSVIHVSSKYKVDTFDWILTQIGYTRSVRSVEGEQHIYGITNYDTFKQVMEQASLKFSDSQLEEIQIKKIMVNAYGLPLTYDEKKSIWVIDNINIEHDTFNIEGNLNENFIYDEDLGKYVLSFDKLFDNEKFEVFNNKYVAFKVSLLIEVAGKQKIVSKNFVVSTLENVVDETIIGSTLKSSVKDAATGAPIVNAQVTLVPGGLTDFTDEEGNYEVSGLAAGEYTILISKPGYQSVEATLTLGEDETKVYEVSLVIDDEHATTLGGADILVKDALNGSVITNGYIRVREGQNNKTGDVVQEIVNSDGNETIHLEMYPGIYTVEIGANGYTNAYNTVTILGDTNTSYEFSISPALAGDQVRIVLTWGESPSDLDSHLVRFTNEVQDYHVAYYDMAPADADANLDIDDISSYGPETITINGVSNSSVYKYYVHDYSNGSDQNDTQLAASGAKVDVYYGDVSQTFYVPNETGNAWKVFEIVNGEIVPCTSECLFGVDGSSDEDIGERSLTQDQTPDSTLFQDLPAK